MDKEAERKFRKSLETTGETSVRADYYGGGGLATGGEDRRDIIRHWLAEKEAEREARHTRSDYYARWTYRVALATLVVAILGVILGWGHK